MKTTELWLAPALRILMGIYPGNAADPPRLGDDSTLDLKLRKLNADKTFAKFSKIALYGAGRHSERLLALDIIPKEKLTAVFDDNPSRQELKGIPVFKSSNAADADFDLLLVSSDAHEAQMLQNAMRWLPEGKTAATIYQRGFSSAERRSP